VRRARDLFDENIRSKLEIGINEWKSTTTETLHRGRLAEENRIGWESESAAGKNVLSAESERLYGGISSMRPQKNWVLRQFSVFCHQIFNLQRRIYAPDKAASRGKRPGWLLRGAGVCLSDHGPLDR